MFGRWPVSLTAVYRKAAKATKIYKWTAAGYTPKLYKSFTR